MSTEHVSNMYSVESLLATVDKASVSPAGIIFNNFDSDHQF